MEEGLHEDEELLVLCKVPVLLKDGGELTTNQQQSILNDFQVKCTTRPVRNGRAGQAGADSTEDTRSWRELTFWGPAKKVEAAVKEAKRLCEETRLQRTMETPEEQQKRLEAKNDRISNLISAKEARKEKMQKRTVKERKRLMPKQLHARLSRLRKRLGTRPIKLCGSSTGTGTKRSSSTLRHGHCKHKRSCS